MAPSSRKSKNPQFTREIKTRSEKSIKKTIKRSKLGQFLAYETNSLFEHAKNIELAFSLIPNSTNRRVLNYSKSFSLKQKLVGEYEDGKCVVIQYGVDSKQLVTKALEVLSYVDDQLGIGTENKRAIKSFSKFYLFVSSKTSQIEGLCLAEPLDKAHRIKYLNKEETRYYGVDENESEEPVKCGISRIWVSLRMRGRRVATRLLDCVCSDFLYVKSLEKSQIAFSAPTEMGQLLAKFYTQSNNFLIYE